MRTENMSIDRIDRYGHCCWCTKNLLTKRVVDGKVVDMFLPIYDEATFMLNNGSQMNVTICKPCKQSVDLNDPVVHDNIMQAVQKGWELETRMLIADDKQPDWTEESGKKYLEKMSELSIDCNSSDMDKYAIQQRQMVLLNKTVEDINGSNINS